MPDELKTVRTFGDAIEAEIAKGQLVAAGIPAVVMGAEGASCLFPGLGNAAGGIKIQVGVADLDRALEILGTQEEEVLDDDWESTTDFQTGEAVHGLSGAQNPAIEPERAITVAVRPGGGEQSIQPAPPIPREAPPDDGKASIESVGLRDVEIGPNDLVVRALILGAIGVLVAPLLPFFQAPFLLWLTLFLAFQLSSTWLLVRLARLSSNFDAPAMRKLYGAIALNVLGWVELAAVLLFVFRVL